MAKIGLYFGSFNPIHIGHLMVAEYLVENSDLAEVWFVVTPRSPFKQQAHLLADHHRLYMVRLAVEDDARFRACDAEFKLPQPSYTVHTLAYLQEKYPNKEFALILGADNLVHFDKWKNWEYILAHFSLYVYPRAGYDVPDCYLKNPNVHLISAPQIEISATFIRNSIQKGKNVKYSLLPKIADYIDKMSFYR